MAAVSLQLRQLPRHRENGVVAHCWTSMEEAVDHHLCISGRLEVAGCVVAVPKNSRLDTETWLWVTAPTERAVW